MTTYRKDAKEHHHNAQYAHVDVQKVQSELWARTNCLLGFTVISILIGCVALAISILLLLQSFDLAGIENAKIADLEMRIKYLEYLTENMQEEEYHVDIPDTKGAPQPPPQPLTPPPTLPPPLPTTAPVPTQPPTPPPVPRTHPELPRTEENEEPNHPNKGTVTRRPPRPPFDDDEDSDGWMEGSGDEVDCPINPPRPICPMGMRVCPTKERCPKYVCCRA